MIIVRNGKALKKIKGPVLTLGNFDGIHLGHQLILRRVKERSHALICPSAVYTFEPHPLKVVAPEKSPPLILDLEDKIRFIEGFGIDFLVLARFTKEFASLHPREFVEEELVKGLSVKEVWVGHDYAFGKGKLGSAEYLKELGAEFGFRVFVMPAYKRMGHIVSSSLVRTLIKKGEVGKAKALLGRPYRVKGKVVRGVALGKEMGFPTANLDAKNEIIPSKGVYAVYAEVAEKVHPAVVNIGIAPTFGGKEKTIEVHILDFEDNIYGRKMGVSFVKRIRDEKHFGSKDALIRQIRRDIERAKRIL